MSLKEIFVIVSFGIVGYLFYQMLRIVLGSDE